MLPTRSQSSPDLTSAEREARKAREWEDLMDEKRRMHNWEPEWDEVSDLGETEAEFYGIDDDDDLF